MYPLSELIDFRSVYHVFILCTLVFVLAPGSGAVSKCFSLSWIVLLVQSLFSHNQQVLMTYTVIGKHYIFIHYFTINREYCVGFLIRQIMNYGWSCGIKWHCLYLAQFIIIPVKIPIITWEYENTDIMISQWTSLSVTSWI